MKAGYLKKQIARHILMTVGYSIVATEYDVFGFKADVFSINQNLFTTEFEVKVSRQDLNSEIKTIRDYTKPSPKRHKHWAYLTGNSKYIEYVPNSFYFVVPEELKDLAVEGVKNTPYGVIVYGVDRRLRGSENRDPELMYCVRAKKLHKEKYSDEMIRKLARRVSVEKFFPRKNF